MRFEKYSLIIDLWENVPIRLHWSILPLAVILTGFKYYPSYLIAFLVLIIIHEIGHALVVRFYRFNVHELFIHGFGGTCFWSGSSTIFQECLIAWGGVFAQFLVFLFFNFSPYFIDYPKNAVIEPIFRVFIGTNLLIVLINLIPFEPCDGAQAWKIFPPLWRRLAKRRKSKQVNQKHIVKDDTVKRQLEEIMKSEPEPPNE